VVLPEAGLVEQRLEALVVQVADGLALLEVAETEENVKEGLGDLVESRQI
jgi:hypothetical protein